MLDILQFYVSGFWVWLGITIGVYVFLAMLALIVHSIRFLRLTKPTDDEHLTPSEE